MVQFPSWLPKLVVVHAESLLSGGHLDKDSIERLTRICTAADMQKTWQVLDRAARDKTLLVKFLNFVLNEVFYLPNSSNQVPLPRESRKSFGKIANLSAALTKELQRLTSNRNKPESGIEELRAALLRIARLPRAAVPVSKVAISPDITAKALTLYELLGDNPAPGDVIDYLNHIATAALLAVNAPPSTNLRKRRAASAARTQYIREIDNFLLLNFERSMPSVVAATINTSLDLHDKAVTEDLVRKIRPSSMRAKPRFRKIPVKNSS